MSEINEARIYAASTEREQAKHALDDDYGFADHVTHEYKLKYIADANRMADEIEEGLHDHNFTIWQRMNYFLTGECTPFLSS